jgi:hypothetical protein
MVDIRTIKNDKNYFWTNHSKYKLFYYNLSPSIIRKVIRNPQRVEEGIAPNTTALMIRKDGKNNKKEIWVMIQKRITLSVKHLAKTKIISAWIYPGVSSKGKEIYVPDDVWEELKMPNEY